MTLPRFESAGNSKELRLKNKQDGKEYQDAFVYTVKGACITDGRMYVCVCREMDCQERFSIQQGCQGRHLISAICPVMVHHFSFIANSIRKAC